MEHPLAKSPYVWYAPERPFAQLAKTLSDLLGYPRLTGGSFQANGTRFKGKHLFVVQTPKYLLPVELQDWSSTYWAKEHPSAFPDSPLFIKLQYDPKESYPENYVPYRFCGFDTELLEKSLGKTENQNTEKLFWIGDMSRGTRGRWFRENPEIVRHVSGSAVWLSPEEYMRLAGTFRFGLSLPGNGNLCYREIDYMALGVVPVMPDLINTITPPLVPFKNYIPVSSFVPEMLQDEHLYRRISAENREMFRSCYTRSAWATGLCELITPYL